MADKVDSIAVEIDFEEVTNQGNSQDAASVVVAPAEEVKGKETKANQKVDFLHSSFTKEFFTKQTKDQSDQKLRDTEPDPTEEVPKQQVPPNNPGSKEQERIFVKENYPTSDDLRDVSGLLMEFFDTGVAMVCGAVSQEKDIKQFEVPAYKRERLTTLLTAILVKHQVKMSIEAMFFVLAVLIYSKPVAKSIEINRKKKMAKIRPLVTSEEISEETVTPTEEQKDKQEDKTDGNNRFSREAFERNRNASTRKQG